MIEGEGGDYELVKTSPHYRDLEACKRACDIKNCFIFEVYLEVHEYVCRIWYSLNAFQQAFATLFFSLHNLTEHSFIGRTESQIKGNNLIEWILKNDSLTL